MDRPDAEDLHFESSNEAETSDFTEQDKEVVDHHAQCDGCGQAIYEVHYKCPVCPNWDYCSTCVLDAGRTHPMHQFSAHDGPISPPSWMLPSENASQVKRLYIDPNRIDFAQLLRRMVKLGLQQGQQFLGQYAPLNTESNEIRLLALMPGTRDAIISCKQVKISLGDDVAYEALSYTWGDTRTTEFITFEDRPFPITSNLYFALQQLRPSETPRYVWIDALCIDQINDEEKSHQVRLMGDIYKHASRVIVWLGQGYEDSDLALDFLNASGGTSNQEADVLERSSDVQFIDYNKKEKGLRNIITQGLVSTCSTVDGESEGVLHERGEVSWWLAGNSVHRQSGQQMFIDPDTIQLPTGGGCLQCELKGNICWWNGEGQCVRCLMNGGKAAGFCSLYESQKLQSEPDEPLESKMEIQNFLTALVDLDNKGCTAKGEEKLNGKGYPRETKRAWLALLKLAGRLWWRRVWVMQEVAMNKVEPLIMCGQKTTTWSKICHFALVTNSDFEAALPGSALTHFCFCTLTYITMREDIQRNSTLNLGRLLRTTLTLECSDARDKVFALLSLAHPIDRLGCKPDYSLPLTTVYTNTMLHLILTSRKLDMLSFQTASDPNIFPSWVSDWSLGSKRPCPIWGDGLYDAAGGRLVEILRSATPNVLAIRGHAVSRVAYLSEPIRIDDTWKSPSPTGLLATLATLEDLVFRALRDHCQSNITPNGLTRDLGKWWRFLALDPDPRNSDAFWRTLVCDSHRLTMTAQSRAPAHWAELFELLRYGTDPDESNANPQAPRRRLSQVLKSVQIQAPRLRTTIQSEVPAGFQPALQAGERRAEYTRPLIAQMQQSMMDRRFFITEAGHMGLTSGEARHGDIMVILLGGDMAYILRSKEEDRNKIGRLEFIGEAYAHGLMRGELFREFSDEETKRKCIVFELQ
ncbi:MAG: hypothetical protein Q9187_007315 [Circinaria calcarea]